MSDDEALNRAVAQGFRTICICRGVRQRTIEVAITKGATTLPEIRRKTAAMTGPCGAKRCTGPIREILRSALERQAEAEAIDPSDSRRPPEAEPRGTGQDTSTQAPADVRAELARIMGVDPDRVSVKATTSERLGFTGREEGIASMAIATLVKS